MLEVPPEFRSSTSDLDKIYVKSTTGSLVPLSSIATARIQTTPLAVAHQGQFPSLTVSFNLGAGYSLGQAVQAIEQARRDIGMSDTITAEFAGSVAEFRASLTSEPYLILAAIVVIYIVLGVLYESYIHPLTILSTLPSAGVGALLALQLSGLDFSLVALIGVVLLIGIVKKNAIMMIDFALEAQRERGHGARRRDLRGLPASFPPHHDDDRSRPARSIAHGTGNRNRLGAPQAAGDCHRRRPAAVSISHALHDACDLSCPLPL